MSWFRDKITQLKAARDIDGLLSALLETDAQNRSGKLTSRRRAAQALGELRDTQAAESLIRILKDRNEPSELQRDVAKALAQIGDHRAIHTIYYFLKGSLEYVADVRQANIEAAIESLGAFGAQAVIYFAKALSYDYLVSDRDRKEIFNCFREKVGRQFVGYLLIPLKSQDGKVRATAAAALAEVVGPSDSDVVGSLVECFGDPFHVPLPRSETEMSYNMPVERRYPVRECVERALRRIGGREATDALAGHGMERE